jgi:hypothetical protein
VSHPLPEIERLPMHAPDATAADDATDNAATERHRATIARLMTILAGKTPIAAVGEFISQDVVSHMDGFTGRGINCWANWIGYIRSRRLVHDLDLRVERIEANPDGTISAYGRWHATWRGREVVSGVGKATYRFEDDRIVDIWTTRNNYLLLFGRGLRSRLWLLGVVVHFNLWRRFVGRIDLTAPAADVAAGARAPGAVL